ncbi:MAG: hypothetical protein IH956_02800 [Chloroflexi bacterium]|nr:hypothetical protein [Chloroflexota bacterium]
MKREHLTHLIRELIDTGDMLVVIDSGAAVAEMHASAMKRLEFQDRWAMLESDEWHIHLELDAVDGVQFVEAVDRFHEGIPKLYYVRLSDADDRTLLRFYFPNPWLDEQERPAEFQPEKLRLFEEFRDRHVGQAGIVFVTRK